MLTLLVDKVKKNTTYYTVSTITWCTRVVHAKLEYCELSLCAQTGEFFIYFFSSESARVVSTRRYLIYYAAKYLRYLVTIGYDAM